MAKKIRADRVRIGMFVESVDRPWLETSFKFQGFCLETPEDVYRIRNTCDFVYISENPGSRPFKPNGKQSTDPNRTQFFSDLQQAQAIRNQSKQLIDTMHEDVTSGSNIDAESAKMLISEMVPTITHNPDAMLWITNLKHKDEYTAIHSINVCILSLAFGYRMGIREEALTTLGLGALLHDIGKLRVPLEILNKPGPLTNDEFDKMREHPLHGRDIIQATHGLSNKILDVALLHHERYSGGGYPYGRKLNQVSDLFAQIVAIVDTYDALTSDRVYRKGLPATEVIKMLYKGKEANYHPNLVEEFSRFIGVQPIGSIVELNTGEVGITLFSIGEKHAKPVVLLILNASKEKYYPLRLIDFNLLKSSANGYHIHKVLAPGSYGIEINEYVNEILFGSSD